MPDHLNLEFCYVYSASNRYTNLKNAVNITPNTSDNAKNIAKEICRTLKQKGYTSYFAGGYVRDLLLGIPSLDIDIATEALPEEIAMLFPNYISVGAQFGVMIVREGAFQFEVATFRSDLEYVGGRKPTGVILRSTPFEDAKRRDFTINGMFLDPESDKVIDYVQGKEDLQQKIIRTIGNPEERFLEDRLRMIRAVRFQNRFGFKIEQETAEAIRKLSHSLVPAVSVERIYMELNKMHDYGALVKALISMHELTLLQTIFPQLQLSFEEINYRLRGFEQIGQEIPVILILACLLQDDNRLLEIVDFFKAANEDKKWIMAYLDIKKVIALKDTSCYEWTKIFTDEKKARALQLLSIQSDAAWRDFCKEKQKEVEPYVLLLKNKTPLLRACDLQELGIQPGIVMGKLLREAEKIGINLKITDKGVLINKLKELYEDDFKHS